MADKMSEQIKIVEKIPFFRGLSLSQARQVIQAGQMAAYEKGYILFRGGDNSNALYILLAGELTVRDVDVEVARIRPVEIVGEMGLVTNQPRCATIEVTQNATVMMIGKLRFDLFMKNDVEMAARIYKNILDTLSQRLKANNDRWRKTQSRNGTQMKASVV